MSEERILRRREVELMTGRSRSSIYEDVRSGQFPAPVRLGKSAVGWRQSEVERWIQERPSARGGSNP